MCTVSFLSDPVAGSVRRGLEAGTVRLRLLDATHRERARRVAPRTREPSAVSVRSRPSSPHTGGRVGRLLLLTLASGDTNSRSTIAGNQLDCPVAVEVESRAPDLVDLHRAHGLVSAIDYVPSQMDPAPSIGTLAA